MWTEVDENKVLGETAIPLVLGAIAWKWGSCFIFKPSNLQNQIVLAVHVFRGKDDFYAAVSTSAVFSYYNAAHSHNNMNNVNVLTHKSVGAFLWKYVDFSKVNSLKESLDLPSAKAEMLRLFSAWCPSQQHFSSGSVNTLEAQGEGLWASPWWAPLQQPFFGRGAHLLKIMEPVASLWVNINRSTVPWLCIQSFIHEHKLSINL